MQTLKREMKRRRPKKTITAFPSTARVEMECHLILTGPGARKLINLYHRRPRLLAINAVGEAEVEWFSGDEGAQPLHKVWREAFEHIASRVSGKLRSTALEMAGADATDKQFFDCEGVKVIQYLWNYNRKYARRSAEEASGELSENDV